MKSKALMTLFAAIFSFQMMGAEPIGVGEDSIEIIRTEVAQQLTEVDKATVDGTEERARICFSVNADGTLHLYQVLGVSQDLKEEIIEHLHEIKINNATTNGDAVWMNVTVEAYK